MKKVLLVFTAMLSLSFGDSVKADTSNAMPAIITYLLDDDVLPVVVYKTGQKTIKYSYDDGFYQSGVTRSFTRDNNKNIVIDNTMNLEWQDNEDTATLLLTYQKANEYCNNLELDGKGWRMPKFLESETLMNYPKNSSPYIDSAFKNVSIPLPYWNKKVKNNEMPTSYTTGFEHGFGILDENSSYHIRCVRGTERKIDERCINGNSIVTCKNGLTYQDTKYAQAVSSITSAISYCEKLELAGYKDWRLPNVNELVYLPQNRFKNKIAGGYFSSTRHGGNNSYWYMSFFTKKITGYASYAKCVRGIINENQK